LNQVQGGGESAAKLVAFWNQQGTGVKGEFNKNVGNRKDWGPHLRRQMEKKIRRLNSNTNPKAGTKKKTNK